jgi:hypothetical protein
LLVTPRHHGGMRLAGTRPCVVGRFRGDIDLLRISALFEAA